MPKPKPKNCGGHKGMMLHDDPKLSAIDKMIWFSKLSEVMDKPKAKTKSFR